MTQELTPNEKIGLLVKKHELGYLFDPGGTLFTNSEKGIKIRVPEYGTGQEDYEKLLNGLVALGLEEPLPPRP
jgi:hypothetical protein